MFQNWPRCQHCIFPSVSILWYALTCTDVEWRYARFMTTDQTSACWHISPFTSIQSYVGVLSEFRTQTLHSRMRVHDMVAYRYSIIQRWGEKVSL